MERTASENTSGPPAARAPAPAHLRLAELYPAPQGEGEFTGTPSVFVRTTGCNLRCWFCDTPFTSWQPEGSIRCVADIVREIARFQCEHVVITGGEPLLQPGLVTLTEQLRQAGHFLTIETAGTVFRPVQADLMSISPKRANSTPRPEVSLTGAASRWRLRHEALRHQPEVIRQLLATYRCQLKFVIDHEEDIADVEQWLVEFPAATRDRVWLMPQAVTREALAGQCQWLTEAARQAGFQFTSREHIAEFGNARGR